ncbi:MAG: hypothetical protein BWY65_01730 [Firmicutes bacterium ADurb.Bin373]|nr:MAG: hypothetical protein BWY65_01730 [Firmicutes bacterium ADurb.Bin373]
MKKYWILGMIAIAFIFLLAGCGKNGAETTEKKVVKPVAVLVSQFGRQSK